MGVCNLCIDDYYLDYKDGKCKSIKESDEFKYCIKVENGICIQCIFPNYYLGEDNKCSNTQNCQESNKGINCKDNYYLDYLNIIPWL